MSRQEKGKRSVYQVMRFGEDIYKFHFTFELALSLKVSLTILEHDVYVQLQISYTLLYDLEHCEL